MPFLLGAPDVGPDRCLFRAGLGHDHHRGSTGDVTGLDDLPRGAEPVAGILQMSGGLGIVIRSRRFFLPGDAGGPGNAVLSQARGWTVGKGPAAHHDHPRAACSVPIRPHPGLRRDLPGARDVKVTPRGGGGFSVHALTTGVHGWFLHHRSTFAAFFGAGRFNLAPASRNTCFHDLLGSPIGSLSSGSSRSPTATANGRVHAMSRIRAYAAAGWPMPVPPVISLASR